jgi:hypothetical protein
MDYAALGSGSSRVPRGGGRHPRGHLRGDLHLLEAVGPAAQAHRVFLW